MKYPFYIFTSGRLKRKENTVFFEPFISADDIENSQDEEILASFGDEITPEWQLMYNKQGHIEKRVIPIETIESIYVFSELSFNTKLLNFCSVHEIPIHFFNYQGFFTGSFYPREHQVSGDLLVEQVNAYQSIEKRLYLSKKILTATTDNILKNLKYYHNRDIELDAEIAEIEKLNIHFYSISEIDELMLNEAAIRKIYYSCFDRVIGEKFLFEYRSRNPPLNPVNALISFGNTLCYTSVLSEIYRTQLNPTIGFLHSTGTRRFTLALDLAEIFKPIMVDRMIFKLINHQQIQSKHFTDALGGCYLNIEGRKIVVKEWDERMKTTIKHRQLKRNVSYRQIMRHECYHLIRFLVNGENYEPFRIWW